MNASTWTAAAAALGADRPQGHCRTLVAGFGRPGMRDLDFGRQLVPYLRERTWPEGVVVEDLSYSALLVLDRLKELAPAKVVLYGAVARGLDPPGRIRRRRLPDDPPSPVDVMRSVEEAAMGVVDLDHTLHIVGHWGGLPADTVVVEVEPSDCLFGPGFSEVLAGTIDDIVEVIQVECRA